MIYWVMAVFVIVGFGGLSKVSAQPVELNFNLFIHAQHDRYVTCRKPWIEKLEKASNGKLKSTPYFSNSLTPMPEKFNSTVDCIADLSEGLVFVNSGRFSMSELLMLPELGLETALEKLTLIESYLGRIKAANPRELMKANETAELVKIAKLTVRAYMDRKESGRGFYWRTDYP